MSTPRRILANLGVAALVLGLSLLSTSVAWAVSFEKRVESIAMRDGVKLNTEIYVPKSGIGPWPILLTRTPYGLRHDDEGFHASLSGAYAELAGDGYIFVFQDIRGRYESEGEFVMLRPPRDAARGEKVDEGTDTYDTIEWLLDNVEDHNERVGILGISYGGWLTVMAQIEPHPALRAASPQASPSDMYLGDDFFHNGAFRLAAGFGYVALMETGKENAPYDFERRDVYDWYLDLGPLSNVDRKYFFGEKPTWNRFMEATSYNDYWQRLGVLQYLTRSEVPTLNVAGWWDAEDFYGPMTIYHQFEEHDTSDHNYLVVGPWRHGGWASGDGDRLGEIPFESSTSRYFREQLQRSFFAHYLKGVEEPDAWGPEATVFETGANLWRRYDEWPPSTSETSVYLGTEGSLVFEPPTREGADSFVSDPKRPVPYVPRPIPGFWQGGQALWKVTDQRFASARPDVLTYQTPPLVRDLRIAGNSIVELHGATTGGGVDWIVKLIDVYPEEHDTPELRGFQLMVADEVLRGRFRDSFEQPTPVRPDVVDTYRFSLGERHHTFRRGHRLMVQIQSTWFPLIGRNPQTDVSIPQAEAADYQAQTHTVSRSPGAATRIVLQTLD